MSSNSIMGLQTTFFVLLLIRCMCNAQLSQNMDPQSSLDQELQPSLPKMWPGVVISQGQESFQVHPGVVAIQGQASVQESTVAMSSEGPASVQAHPVFVYPPRQASVQARPMVLSPLHQASVQARPMVTLPPGQASVQVRPEVMFPQAQASAQVRPMVVSPEGQLSVQVRPGAQSPENQRSAQVHPGVVSRQGQGWQRVVVAHGQSLQQAGIPAPQKPTSVKVWPGAMGPQGPVSAQERPGVVAVQGQALFQGRPGVSSPQRPASVQVQPGVLSSAVLEVESQQVVNPDSVKVVCGETLVHVEVQRDLLGIGQLIQPSDITMGGCPATVQDPSDRVLMFEAPLEDCGSIATMLPDALVYSFLLLYVPKGIGDTPIVRTNGVVVTIECYYLRRHNVSSNALVPTLKSFYATKSAEDHLVFSLRLMTDDWQLERSSNEYSLGDFLNIEASVMVAHHQPLHVYLDGCVATLGPDLTAEPRHDLVANHGCLTDSKETGSRSQFLPRKQADKLQMQLDAFRFTQMTSNSIYITCHLKASVASGITDEQHKACSFSTNANRWLVADGNDGVCGCCDTSCKPRKGRALAGLQWDYDAVLGPISIAKGHSLDAELVPDVHFLKAEDQIVPSGFSPEVLTLAGIVAGVGLVTLLVLVIVLQRCGL